MLTDEQILMIGRRALDKVSGTEAQHLYIAREVERAALAQQAATPAPAAADALTQWAALDEGEATDWHKGYEAARRWVRMQLAAPPATPAAQPAAQAEPLKAALREMLEAWEEQFGEGACDCQPEPENAGHVCQCCMARLALAPAPTPAAQAGDAEGPDGLLPGEYRALADFAGPMPDGDAALREWNAKLDGWKAGRRWGTCRPCHNCDGLGYRHEANGEPIPCDLCEDDSQAGEALPPTVRDLFVQALAWGLVYGPLLPDRQWDEMRDKMAAQFTEQARAALAARGQAGPPVGAWVNADDVARLARELDVAMNGEAGAAERPSLCDVVSQAVREFAARGQAGDAVTVDAFAWDAFVRDYDRYNAGDPKMPFAELRQSLAAVIDSAASAALKGQPEGQA